MQDGPQVSGHIRSLPWGLNAFEEVDSLHLYDFVLPDLGGVALDVTRSGHKRHLLPCL